MEQQLSLFKNDGWINILSGLGKRADKSKYTYFGDFELLIDTELTRMWLGEGLGKKIVSVVADDMTRNWITVEGDPNNKIQKELTKLESKTRINEALKWARLYRGCIIVVGVNDGRELKEPISKNIKGIEWLKVYPAPNIINTTADIVTDPKSPYFEDFEVFKIQKLNGGSFDVHRTRTLIFKGDPVPPVSNNYVDTVRRYWGVSILQSIWDRLKNYAGTEKNIVNLLYEIVIGKYKLSNLAQILSDNNTEAVLNRIEIINMAKSVINAVLLGEDEDYTRDAVNTAGIPDIMDRFMMSLSAVCEIPVTRLFGRSPAGQNATGESDERIYYDMVSSKQETWLAPPLQYLVNLIGMYINTESEPIINFNSVWEPTQEQMIEMKNKQALTDQIYVDLAVLSSEEVRESRFKNGYSFDTTLLDEGED